MNRSLSHWVIEQLGYLRLLRSLCLLSFFGFSGLFGFFSPSEIGFTFHPIHLHYRASGINLFGLFDLFSFFGLFGLSGLFSLFGFERILILWIRSEFQRGNWKLMPRIGSEPTARTSLVCLVYLVLVYLAGHFI